MTEPLCGADLGMQHLVTAKNPRLGRKSKRGVRSAQPVKPLARKLSLALSAHVQAAVAREVSTGGEAGIFAGQPGDD